MNRPHALTHNEANELLGDYIANELSEQVQLQVTHHLNTCELCQIDYREIRRIYHLLGTIKAPEEKSTSPSLADAVLMRLDTTPIYVPEELDALLADTIDEFSATQESEENIRPLFPTPGVLDTESASYSQKRYGQEKKQKNMNNEKKSYENGRTYRMESRVNVGNRTRKNTLWLTLVAVLVLAIVAGSLFTFRTLLFGDHNNGPTRPGITTPVPKVTPTPTAKPSPTLTPTQVVTQQMPPTQTDCPADGTARAMVTAPLAQGADPQIVYVPQTGHDITTHNRIMSYDTVTHISTELLNAAPGFIRWTSLSSNGQWVLIGYDTPSMVGPSSAYVEVQVMRIDGQGLQTLYCGNNTNFTWSPDLHWIAFDDPIQYVGSADTIHLLDTTTGQLLTEVDIPQQNTAPHPHNPIPAFWLSNTQLYLEDIGGVTTFNDYLVNTANGEHQSMNSLDIVSQQVYVGRNDAVTDGTNLFAYSVTCPGGQPQSACSNDQKETTLVHLPALGGTPQTIFQDSQLFIDSIAVMNSQNILLMADNVTAGTRELWVVKSDGSSHTRIASANATFGTGSGQISPYAGSVIPSLDGQHFVVTGWPTADGSGTQICYGTPDSSTLTTLDTGGDSTGVLGWTNF